MTIPDYQSIMLPLLKFSGDNQEHSMREAIEHIADTFNLSVTTLKKSIPITSRNGVQAKQGGALFFYQVRPYQSPQTAVADSNAINNGSQTRS